MTDMTNTPTLTIHALGSIAWHLSYRALAAECGDLELTGEGEIPAAALTELREVWGLLLAEGDYVAADWLAAHVNARGSSDPSRRFDRLAEDLGPLATNGGHLTLLAEDGPFTVICESCTDYTPGVPPRELILGRDYPTVAEAEEAAVRHVAEAGALRGI
jgi:hypothetical protein